MLRNVVTIIDNIGTDVPESLPMLLGYGCAEQLMLCLTVADDAVREVCSALLSKLSEDSLQFATRVYDATAASGAPGPEEGASVIPPPAGEAGPVKAEALVSVGTAPQLTGVKLLVQVRVGRTALSIPRRF